VSLKPFATFSFVFFLIGPQSVLPLLFLSFATAFESRKIYVWCVWCCEPVWQMIRKQPAAVNALVPQLLSALERLAVRVDRRPDDILVTEFSDLLDLYGDAALLHNKEDAAQPLGSNGKVLPTDLEAMRYQGEPGMHNTFMGYVRSRLGYGDTLADIIERVVEAAERNCAEDPGRPKWRHTLADMATWYLKEHPEWLATALDAGDAERWEQALIEGRKPVVIWKSNAGIEVRRARESIAAAEERQQGERPQKEQPRDTSDAPKIKFKLKHYTELRLDLEEQLYLVDELIPAAGLVIIWGKPKCFKSFLALDIMFHVVQGWEWHDRAVRQGSAIYCAFEGAHGYRKRIAALLSHYGLDYDDNAPLHVIAGNANLIADHRILIRDIKSQLGDEKINAIVLDTLNKSLHGSESKDVDMANYIRAAEALRDTFNCVVVIVHHCGYDETRPRGHSSLPGAVNVQAAVTRDGALVTMEIEYMRDGPEGTIVTGEAKSIEVGVDSNGKPLTSLVIVPIDKPPEVPQTQGLAPQPGRFSRRSKRSDFGSWAGFSSQWRPEGQSGGRRIRAGSLLQNLCRGG